MTAISEYPAVMLTAAQIRAARAMLNWTQRNLAEKAGISVPGVKNLEREAGNAQVKTIRAIQAAFEAEGIEVISNGGLSAGSGPGIRMRERE